MGHLRGAPFVEMSTEYELILMLDPEVPDERRDEIAGNARKRIDDAGTLRHSETWGMRKLAFEIKQRNEADYRFYRFQSEPALLNDLDHTLKITDGILRFRLFGVDPRAPIIEPPASAQLGTSRSGGRDDRGRGGGRGRRDDRADTADSGEAQTSEAPPAEEQAAPAAEAPAEPAPEPPAEPAPEAPAEPAEAPAEPAPEAPAEPAAEAEPAPAERP